jgi:photosystem II stability/assembly factor-like uncharacterized protein
MVAASASAKVARPPLAFTWLQMVDREHGYALSGENANYYRLLSTHDGGFQWTDITPGRGTVHPSGPLSIVGSTLLFSTKVGSGRFVVERSDDAGHSWQRSLPFRDVHGQAAGQPFALDARHLFLAVDEGAAAGSQGEALFTSSDGGHHWRLMSQTSVNGDRKSALPFGCDKSGFGFATSARGWAGGYCAGGSPFFFRTDDGGRSWQRQSLPVSKQCACETTAPLFFTPRVGGLSVFGFTINGGGRPITRTLWTSDGGDHWRASTPPGGRATNVSFANADAVWITAQTRGQLSSPYNLLIRTTDAGRHWQTTKLPFDASNFRMDALSATAAFGFKTAFRSDVIITTVDGGLTWRTISAKYGS